MTIYNTCTNLGQCGSKNPNIFLINVQNNQIPNAHSSCCMQFWLCSYKINHYSDFASPVSPGFKHIYINQTKSNINLKIDKLTAIKRNIILQFKNKSKCLDFNSYFVDYLRSVIKTNVQNNRTHWCSPSSPYKISWDSIKPQRTERTMVKVQNVLYIWPIQICALWFSIVDRSTLASWSWKIWKIFSGLHQNIFLRTLERHFIYFGHVV